MPRKRNKKAKKRNQVIRPKTQVVKSKSKKQGLAPGLLGNIGEAAGGFFFGNPGAKIGHSLGDLLGKITGMGDYKVNANTLMTNNGPPVFGNGSGSVRVRHREFLCDVTSSTAFSAIEYTINPGNSTTFPWLSSVASAYEQYSFKGLIFEFRSTSATAVSSTNTALGTLVMSTNYDVNDPPFADKRSMEAYLYTVSTVPSRDIIHPVECKPGLNVLTNYYINHESTPPADTDARFYDMGKMTLATTGMQAASTIGELWVSYDVVLSKPVLYSSGCASQYSTAAGGSVSALSILVPDVTYTDHKSKQLLFSRNDNLSLNILEAGDYLMACKWFGSGNYGGNITYDSNSTNIDEAPAWGNIIAKPAGLANDWASNATASLDRYFWGCFTATSNNAVFKFDSNLTSGDIDYMSILLVKLPRSFTSLALESKVSIPDLKLAIREIIRDSQKTNQVTNKKVAEDYVDVKRSSTNTISSLFH